ncbi:MAG: hypothetical protein ACK5XA_08565 [Tagaea sp.]
MKQSILDVGVRQPVAVQGDLIIDGKTRWTLCQELGLECPTVQVEGDPVELIRAFNDHRRHMTEAQRAWVAAGFARFRDGQRKSAAGAAPAGAPDAPAPAGAPVLTQPEAAAVMAVSRRAVQRARVVAERAVPEVGEAVRNGAMPLQTAVRVAELPPEQQRAVAAGEAPAPVAPRKAPAPATPPAEVEQLRARVAELEQDLEDTRSALSEVSGSLKAAMDAADPEAVKKFAQLEQQLRIVTQTRDAAMRENAELKRENKGLRRRLEADA